MSPSIYFHLTVSACSVKTPDRCCQQEPQTNPPRVFRQKTLVPKKTVLPSLERQQMCRKKVKNWGGTVFPRSREKRERDGSGLFPETKSSETEQMQMATNRGPSAPGFINQSSPAPYS